MNQKSSHKTPAWIFVVIGLAVVGTGVGVYFAKRGGGASDGDKDKTVDLATRTKAVTIHPPEVARPQTRSIRADRIVRVLAGGERQRDLLRPGLVRDGALSLGALPEMDTPAPIDSLAAARTQPTSQDDPPPPPPDDGSDESGGTGTMMALEEGKMGKKETDRAEGSYQMRNLDPDADLLGVMDPTNDDGGPASLPLVIADRDVPASAVVDALRLDGGSIAVSTGEGDRVRAFAVAFILSSAPPPDGDRVAISLAGGHTPSADELASVAGKPVWIDPGDVSANALVATLAAVSAKGPSSIHFGTPPAPAADDQLAHAATGPDVRIGQPNAVGDLDKDEIRRVIKRNIQKLTYCYEKQLLVKPDLAGTVATQFFIAPDGSVATANATGVDPDVATCVADTIRKMQFPKPRGGGGVQVNYPFTFRSTGD
ncbi:MAG TPA: AgmX/PglI C-terminal domain-containing protein [Kofleriaceae bacterium]|nr:AgmX/PglI C-terminal domain-containing protein [Kofleriaceae bacterium]